MDAQFDLFKGTDPFSSNEGPRSSLLQQWLK
jgi:hypothetical protein